MVVIVFMFLQSARKGTAFFSILQINCEKSTLNLLPGSELFLTLLSMGLHIEGAVGDDGGLVFDCPTDKLLNDW